MILGNSYKRGGGAQVAQLLLKANVQSSSSRPLCQGYCKQEQGQKKCFRRETSSSSCYMTIWVDCFVSPDGHKKLSGWEWAAAIAGELYRRVQSVDRKWCDHNMVNRRYFLLLGLGGMGKKVTLTFRTEGDWWPLMWQLEGRNIELITIIF
jgi:hypothetical protein